MRNIFCSTFDKGGGAQMATVTFNITNYDIDIQDESQDTFGTVSQASVQVPYGSYYEYWLSVEDAGAPYMDEGSVNGGTATFKDAQGNVICTVTANSLANTQQYVYFTADIYSEDGWDPIESPIDGDITIDVAFSRGSIYTVTLDTNNINYGDVKLIEDGWPTEQIRSVKVISNNLVTFPTYTKETISIGEGFNNVDVEAIPESGYKFDHWIDENGNTVSNNFNVASDCELTAIFVENIN